MLAFVWTVLGWLLNCVAEVIIYSLLDALFARPRLAKAQGTCVKLMCVAFTDIPETWFD